VREDWGTVLDVDLGGQTYILHIHWLAERQHEDKWGIQFSRRVGFVRYLLGRRARPESCRAIQRIVAEIIDANPETFFAIEWLSQSEYECRL
jgi:hypothetical protein